MVIAPFLAKGPELVSCRRAGNHSITSSARAKSIAGTSRPRVFAVFRLAPGTSWKLLSVEIREFREIETAFNTAVDDGAGALLVPASGLLFSRARQIAELATMRRLPAMYELRPFVDSGGLVSYGANIEDIWRHAATYVDKILRGTKPAELPIEQPTKFELVINSRAAAALGLTIPPAILIRADEVID
jgi:putative tryptophan/tyrosine transport system substrate-binding protein